MEKKNGGGSYATTGMCIGMCLGLAIGTACNQMPIGLSLGMCFGLAIGSAIKRKEEDGADDAENDE